MKPVLAHTFYFFIVLITNFSLAFSNDAGNQILDVNGKPVIPGGKYYIIPASRPAIGGLRLGKTNGLECKVTVIQYYEFIKGIPVKFSIPGISPGIISTGTPIDIEFTTKPDCAESSKWLIYVEDKVIITPCVGIGSPQNYPDFKTLNGTFYIKRHDSGLGYKLIYCVNDSTTCLNIGTSGNVEEEEGSRLILTQLEAYAFVIVDAATFEDGVIKSVV